MSASCVSDRRKDLSADNETRDQIASRDPPISNVTPAPEMSQKVPKCPTFFISKSRRSYPSRRDRRPTSVLSVIEWRPRNQFATLSNQMGSHVYIDLIMLKQTSHGVHVGRARPASAACRAHFGFVSAIGSLTATRKGRETRPVSILPNEAKTCLSRLISSRPV
jgi:hypothetical protein